MLCLLLLLLFLPSPPQARALSVSAATAAPASSTSTAASALRPLPGQTAAGTDNPLTHMAGGLGVSALARPAGRQSVSGIVATVFGCSGHLGRYVVRATDER